MDEPIAAPERARDRLTEAYLISTRTAVADPLGLPVAEFDGLLSLIARGELVRADGQSQDCRSYVERAVAGGFA